MERQRCHDSSPYLHHWVFHTCFIMVVFCQQAFIGTSTNGICECSFMHQNTSWKRMHYAPCWIFCWCVYEQHSVSVTKPSVFLFTSVKLMLCVRTGQRLYVHWEINGNQQHGSQCALCQHVIKIKHQTIGTRRQIMASLAFRTMPQPLIFLITFYWPWYHNLSSILEW